MNKVGRGFLQVGYTVIDDLMFPPEELIFEKRNVKYSRVRYVKGEDGFYHGPLVDGDLYAVDVESGGKSIRFGITYDRITNRPDDVGAAVKFTMQSWRDEFGEAPAGILPEDIRKDILTHLHEETHRIVQHTLGIAPR